MQQELSSGFGVKRSSADDEAVRRADAEAEKAWKRAQVTEERRETKRASATSVQGLEEPMETEKGVSCSEAALTVAAEAVLAETRETLDALIVSALQQTHVITHQTDTTAQGFFQVHKDKMTTTTSKDSRNSTTLCRAWRFMRRRVADDVPSGTRVMSGRWVETMKTHTWWTAKWTVRRYEEPHSVEGCFAATARIQGVRMVLSRCAGMVD